MFFPSYFHTFQIQNQSCSTLLSNILFVWAMEFQEKLLLRYTDPKGDLGFITFLRKYFQFFIWSQELQLFLRCLLSLWKVWWLLKPILSTQAKIMWNYHIRYTVVSRICATPYCAIFAATPFWIRLKEIRAKFQRRMQSFFFFHFNANLITNPDYDCSQLSFEVSVENWWF